MPSPHHSRLPNSFLAPEQLDLGVARAIEVAAAEEFRHDMILQRAALRPGSERTPTPLRFFCLPFEDLLTVDRLGDVKQKGCIARDSIAPVWIWLSGTLLPRETKSYCHRFKAAMAAGDHAQCKAHAAAFWALTGQAMRAALADEAGRNTARRTLKRERILADAEEVALLLSVAPSIMAIHDVLVRPVPVLTDEMLHSLRAIRDGLSVLEPEAVPYVAMIAMTRLASPGEASKLTAPVG